MWKAGVSLVIWYSLEDEPLATSYDQSGLSFVNGKPKPSLEAFRSPSWHTEFQGCRRWGQRPRVVVECLRRAEGRKRLATARTVKTNPPGIFTASFTSKTKEPLRASLVGSKNDFSQPFSLKELARRWLTLPFGES